MAASGSRPTAEADWRAPYVVDLTAVLGPFRRGRFDPTIDVAADGAVWRTTRTHDGPATLRLSAAGGTVRSEAWGPGAQAAVDAVPDLLGAGDDPSGFPAALLPAHLAAGWTRLAPRWRVPRSGRVLEALAAAVLEQKVTGVEARRSWTALLNVVGDRAPGPTPRPMRVFPEPEAIRQVPSWQWHRWGVQPAHSATLVRAARHAGRLEECAGMDPADSARRLRAVDGIGVWTAAEVAQRALGDADAVSFGDFHLAGQVGYAFTGRRDGTNEQMAELLAPFAGHRYRVQRLVEEMGITKPRRGPRATVTDHRRR